VSFVAEGIYHGSLVRDRCRFVSIHVKPALIFSQPALIELFLRPFSPDGRFYKISGRPALAREIIAFAPFYNKYKNNPRRLVMRLLELMRHFESFPVSREQPVSAEKERLKPAVSMMYERFAEPVGVPEMAKACALSRAAFYRRFSRAYGANPKAMLNSIRLRHAVILLMNTEKKITEIAFDCGFFSLSNFNRAFMEETGRAPREYRKAGGRRKPVK
jgi:AraC-like DNA-binding protein